MTALPAGAGVGAAIFLLALVCAACSDADTERRGRETFEKVQESMPNRIAVALEQKVTPEEVAEAQKSLTAAKEYMGEINGKLDAVTVNAIQAFQRSRGLEDDGLLDDKTKELLAEVKS
jgi:peptidoglycan hydrolase-like protein with peptidoglycan-binding domain